MLKPYDEYQKCNLPWLNKVPKHWTWLRNKNIFHEEKEIVGDRKNEFVLLSLTKNGVIVRDLSTGKGKFPKDFDTYKVVNPENMIFCLFDVDETPRTVGLSKYHGMITGAYEVFSVNNIYNEYIYYYYLAFDNVKAFKPLYSGLRKVIPLPSFMSTKIPVPPISEQKQIVSYLNWKTAQMDYFVKEKEKEIKDLQEFKLRIINDSTTQGINHNSKKKVSSALWMGKEIPNHWNILPSKRLFALRKEKAYDNDVQLTASQKYGIVSQDWFMKKEGRRVTVVIKGEEILKHVEKGDFVISMRSFQGGIEYSENTGKISSAYVMLIPDKEKVYAPYFKWLLKSQSYIKALRGTSDLVRDGQALRYSNFAEIYLPLIPLNEQKEIAEYIDKKCIDIDNAISNITQEIALVNELRTSTIADVVTGKVDVRNVKIPEEYKVV